MSTLYLVFPDVSEIDVNPFRGFAAGEGGHAPGGRILLGPRSG